MIRMMMLMALKIAGDSMAEGEKIRILIIDDNHAIGETLSEIFRAYRYHVEFMTSGRDALRKFKTAPYHIVLLDMIMPDLNGVEVMRRIKKVDSNAKVILMTGHAEDRLLEEAKKLKPDYILHKPISPEVLLKHVQSIL